MLLLSFGVVTPMPAQESCDHDGAAVGGAVLIGVGCDEYAYPGDGEGGNAPGPGGDAAGTVGPFIPIYEENPCNPHEDTASQCAHNGYILLNPANPGEPVDPDDPVEARPITVRDVERFAPDQPNIVVEPEGWGLVGKPVNVYSDSGEQTTEGEVLDIPVTIVWTPVSITIDYGDGTVVTSSDQGTAWGDGQYMTETVTSHSYSDTGDYVISGSIEYAPRVLIGGQEVIVQGTVSVDTNEVTISIYWVKTRLTQGDCLTNPSAPRCPV